MSHPPIGAQMYTVREAVAENFQSALERVAKIGYAGVELAGLFGLTAAEVSQMLNDLGLRCSSAHVPLTDLRDNLSREIDLYQAIGVDYLICPWIPSEERGGEEFYRTMAEDLNRIGERCRASGLQLCYHHHDFELVQFNGKYALDILLEESDPANLKLEADTYWLEVSGEDPTAYINRWAGRVPLLHLKDASDTKPVTFAEVGEGTLDWSGIFDAAQAGGTQWYIVEQDTCSGDPFDSLKISFENLGNLLR